MLVCVESHLCLRWIEQGPWWWVFCTGAAIEEGWEGSGGASNLASASSTTKEAETSGCVHTQGIFCVFFTMCVFSSSVESDSVTKWTVAFPAPLSSGFPRQEYWRVLPFPSPRDLLNLGIEPMSLALTDGFFATEPPRKPLFTIGPIFCKVKMLRLDIYTFKSNSLSLIWKRIMIKVIF